MVKADIFFSGSDGICGLEEIVPNKSRYQRNAPAGIAFDLYPLLADTC
jgi:hypothetical protein